MEKAQDEKEIVITLDRNALRGKMLQSFYVYVAECMGYEDETIVSYNCTKILVAKNVQDTIIEAYRKKYADQYAKNPMEVDLSIIQKLAICGPKMDEDLSDNQVKIEDGFLTFKETIEAKEKVMCGNK